MGKQKCILGTNCPNQIAKRNVQFQLSEDDSDLSVQESCVFCGNYTAKKKKVVEVTSPWSNSSNNNFSMKRTALSDIDSLCGMKTVNKKKKEDIDDKINFFKAHLFDSNKGRKGFEHKTLTIDSDSDDLSDSGVKSDYESPTNSEANSKKKDETENINGFGLNIRKGKIISRSPSPVELGQSTNFTFNPPVEVFNSNEFNKNVEKSNNSNSCEDIEPDWADTSSMTSSIIDIRSFVPSPIGRPPLNSDTDPFEFDSDHDYDRKNLPKSSAATNSNSNSKDVIEAGPSSRPDVTFESSQDNIPTDSFDAHHSGSKSRFMNLTYMPKHKVERLLFKSFKLQILNEFSSSSDEDDIKLYQAPKKAPKRKRKGKSQPVKNAVFTSSQKIGSGFYRWKKRRRVQNSWSDDEDSNMTYASGDQRSDPDDDDTDEDDDGCEVRAMTISNNAHNEHDYSTSEFHKIAEANIDNLAFETEKLNWDDTVMIDDTSMHSFHGHRMPDDVITLDDSPERFTLPLVRPTDGVVTIHESDSEPSRSPENDANTTDHMYCVNELKKEPSPVKQTDDNEKDDDKDEPPPNPSSEVPQNGRLAQKVWECPICLEPSNGQEVATTVCGHVFCRDCIESYLSTSSRCPTCRKDVNKKDLITLYM